MWGLLLGAVALEEQMELEEDKQQQEPSIRPFDPDIDDPEDYELLTAEDEDPEDELFPPEEDE